MVGVEHVLELREAIEIAGKALLGRVLLVELAGVVGIDVAQTDPGTGANAQTRHGEPIDAGPRRPQGSRRKALALAGREG